MDSICTRMEGIEGEFFKAAGQSKKLRATALENISHEEFRNDLRCTYNCGALRYVVLAHIANLFYTVRCPQIKIGSPLLSVTLLEDPNIPEATKADLRDLCKSDRTGFINNKISKQMFAVIKNGVFFRSLLNSHKKGVCTVYVLTDKTLRRKMGWLFDDETIARDLRIGEKMAGIEPPVIESVLEAKI